MSDEFSTSGEPLSEETIEESRESNFEGGLELYDQIPEHENNDKKEPGIDEEPIEKDIEDKDSEEETLTQFLVANSGCSEENSKLEYQGMVVLSELTEDQKLAQADLLATLTTNPGQSHMLPDHRDGKTTYFTAVKMNTEGIIEYEIRSVTDKEESEEKPIDSIEGTKTAEEDLNLEINLDKEKEEIRDKEILVDIPLSVEAQTVTEKTVERVEAAVQGEVSLGAPEVDHIVEVDPVVTLDTEHAEPNEVSDVMSSEKSGVQDPIQTVEQPAAEIVAEKIQEQEIDRQVTEKILDLLKDEPAVSEKPDIKEEVEEVRKEIEVPEMQIPAAAETVEQIHAVAEEQPALVDNKAAENIKVSAPEIKTTDNPKNEATKPETIIMRKPETKTEEPIKTVVTGVVSPYVEIRTTLKAEIKPAEKEVAPGIEMQEKIQVIEPENTEEIVNDHTTELVSATSENQEIAEETVATAIDKEIKEAAIETPIEAPVASREIEIKNEIPKVIENIKIETAEVIQNLPKEPKEIEREATKTKLKNMLERNDEARSEKFMDTQSVAAEKTLPIAEKMEKNLAIDGHGMLLRILGIPQTRNKPNLNESIQIRPIPYSAIEADSANTKPTGGKSKIINTLNGITLKRAA
ncbi:hypothetical protein HYW73_02270 [Candidatus Nomurabacteria bacterium]|nr:hypothetical protein [Candidatus Nomurabacteria bacterium]